MKLKRQYLSLVVLSVSWAVSGCAADSSLNDWADDAQSGAIALERQNDSVVYNPDKLLPQKTMREEYREFLDKTHLSPFFDINVPQGESEKPESGIIESGKEESGKMETGIGEAKKGEELLASSSDANKASAKPATSSDASAIDPQLKSALEYVYENHPALREKREELKATDEQVAQAVSGFRPDISANLGRGRQRTGNVADKWNYNDTRSRSLDVVQPIFNGGGTIASLKEARETVKAKRAELSALEQQTLYDAVVAYSDVVEKKLVLALNQKNVDVLTKQLAATKARFEVGILTITDVAQATSRLAAAQSSERQVLGDLEVSKATFMRVVGYVAPEKIDMPNVPVGIPDDSTQAAEIARSNSPILEAAKRAEKAAENNVYVNGATILPSVTLQGSMNRDRGFSNTINHLDSDAIALNVSIPIYQSGAEWSRLRAARNQAQQAKFNTMDTHAAVVESVSSAWESFKTAQAIITSNEAAVRAAETALEGVRKENEFGVRTVLDVLDAEQEAFNQRVNLVKAQRVEKLMAYRLLATIGKLTSKDLNLNTSVESPKEHYDSVKYQLLGW